MPENIGPLTEVDLEEINQRLEELNQADKLIAQSLNAGIDVSLAQTRSKELRAQLLKMKQAFFPGR